MSVLDNQEIHLHKIDAGVSWEVFRKKYVDTRFLELSRRGRCPQYILGLYVPDDFPYGIAESITSFCNINHINNYVVNAASILHRTDLSDFYLTLLNNDYSVVIIENFDEVPDSPEQKYIENLLVAPFTSGTLLPRDRFFILFITHKDYGAAEPQVLKKVSRLKWLGNIEDLPKQND